MWCLLSTVAYEKFREQFADPRSIPSARKSYYKLGLAGRKINNSLPIDIPVDRRAVDDDYISGSLSVCILVASKSAMKTATIDCAVIAPRLG